ncbi:MAG: PAS domain-containing sensor histidine kinase [Methanomicrobiales archaeon]|nr:PAS domain-containing sensor histidine kinase [Methanomicrobiales archaeon]
MHIWYRIGSWWLVGAVPGEGFGFLEGIPLPAVLLDPEGAIVHQNARFFSLLGRSPGENHGSDGFGFVDLPDRGMARSLLGGMSREGSVSLRASLLRKDGGRVRVLGFWSLFGGPESRPPLYLGLFIEVPETEPPGPREHQGKEGVHASHTPGTTNLSAPGESDPGAIGSSRRNQIIHTIVFHDAKNRIAALHGYAALLRESLAGSGFLAYLDKLDEIASDLERDLGVASIFSHLGLIAPQWQNLRETVMKSASRDTGARIFLDELPSSLWCLADPLFPRVFANLFENARRHGERVTTIRIRAREGEAGLVISVEDDGIGIPADQKERIFELGFGRHTGYGLYLAREILAIAGQSIRETGDPGKGARFDIHVPRGRYLVHPSCPEEPETVRIPAA